MRSEVAPPAVRVRRGAAVLRQLVCSWHGAVVRAPALERRQRQGLAVRLAADTLDALGVGLAVRGPVPGMEPRLLVGNHVSWLDVYALNAVVEARFVAKSETRTWPVAGRIARGFDTIFIVRGSIRDAARVKTAVAAALRAGEHVVLFPEGTTTDGTRLRRFHPALFQAAIDAGVAVQPIVIRYPDRNGRPNPAAAFIDDMSFVGSLGRVMWAEGLRAEVIFGEPISPAGRTRRELARLARETVARELGLDPSALEPERLPIRARRALTAA